MLWLRVKMLLLLLLQVLVLELLLLQSCDIHTMLSEGLHVKGIVVECCLHLVVVVKPTVTSPSISKMSTLSSL